MNKFVLTEKKIPFSKFYDEESIVLFINNKMAISWSNQKVHTNGVYCLLKIRKPYVRQLIVLKKDYRIHTLFDDYCFLVLPHHNNKTYSRFIKNNCATQELINKTITFFHNRIIELENLQRGDSRHISNDFDKFLKSFNKKAFELYNFKQ